MTFHLVTLDPIILVYTDIVQPVLVLNIELPTNCFGGGVKVNTFWSEKKKKKKSKDMENACLLSSNNNQDNSG